MNHQKSGRKLERNRNQRRALVKSLAEGLVLHGRIRTTEARAKEMKSRIDRLVNIAKEGISVPDRRVATIRLLKRSPGIKRGMPGGYGVSSTLVVRPSSSSISTRSISP